MGANKRTTVLVLCALGAFALILFLWYQYRLDQRSITWRDYTRVSDGMTQAEIESVLRVPWRIEPKPDGGKIVRWMGRKQGMISVEFTTTGAMVRKYFDELAVD